VLQDAVKKAYFNRVNLSAQGFRCQQFTGYDWNMDTDDNSKRGKGPFEYITGGVCCAEVEVDVLTGDHTVRRVDIVMDIGNSVNPAIDVGQVEGAFTQGMGWATIEECVWGDSVHPWVRPGNLFTRGPGTYKPPAFNDTPVDMRVSLLHNAPNPRAIYSSKAIGEPPLFLGCTVGFAVQYVVKYCARLRCCVLFDMLWNVFAGTRCCRLAETVVLWNHL
jgi:xanthine dehydrogenase/oxidase